MPRPQPIGGLVNSVVPDDGLDAAVADLVGRAGRGSALAKGAGKRGFYAQIDLDQSAAYDYASELMSTGAMTPRKRSTRSSRSAGRCTHNGSEPSPAERARLQQWPG